MTGPSHPAPDGARIAQAIERLKYWQGHPNFWKLVKEQFDLISVETALRSETAPQDVIGAFQAQRNEALEEAARECEKEGRRIGDSDSHWGPEYAKRIRAIKDHAPHNATPPNRGVVESLVGQLRRSISHTECDDPWYSCSQHDSCADDRRKGEPCDCGAQVLNELHAHAADALERQLQR